MIYTDSDIYCLQLLTFFVTQCDYQIVTLRQTNKNDYWLANAKNEEYPILRICNEARKELISDETYLKGVHQAVCTAIQRDCRLTILNTSDKTTDLENGIIHQFAIGPNHEVLGNIRKVFPGIESVIHRVSNNQDEYSRLTRLLERKALTETKEKRLKFKDLPRCTMILILVCSAMFLLVNLLATISGDLISAAIFAGGYYKMSVVAGLEYFRLFTAGFIHYDIFHLLMNMMALVNLGMICEKKFSRIQFLTILFISILVGNIFVFIGDANIAGMGISGGLFGLLGAYIVSLIEDGSIRNPLIRVNLMSTVMMNLFISFLPNISLMAHLGGFIAGAMLAFVMIPKPQWKQLKLHTRNAMVLLLVGVFIIIPKVQRIDPVYPGTDAYLITMARKLNIDFYADYMQKNFTKQMLKQNDAGYTIALENAIKEIEAK